MTTRLRVALPAALAILTAATPLRAQNTSSGEGVPSSSERVAEAPQGAGRILGHVVDSETGDPISGAQVVVAGTSIGTLSGVDGRYVLPGVPAGTRSLQVTYIGYGDKTVEGVEVKSGGTVLQNVTLSQAAIEVAGITVSAARETGSVSAALNEQRTSVGVISATTSEQIARSPDSDAAQAIKRVSGVTVQDGKYVFVRGLGERYTTTSLDGARVPSPEPEKKVVPLDLFPANLLQSITTSKTFTPDQPGDFSGAEVNLKTRSFPTRTTMQLSVSGGLDSRATGKDIPMPVTTGGEWLANAASARKLPSALTNSDYTTLGPADLNQIIRSMPRDWTFGQAPGQPDGSASLSVGGENALFGQRIGYVGSLTYSHSQEVQAGEVRAQAVPADTLGTPRPYDTFQGSTGKTSVLWGGLLNLSAYLGRSTKITLNNTYDRTADNQAHLDWGTIEEFQQVDSVRRTMLDYVERSVRSDQLKGEHQIGDQKLTWSVTSSAVRRSEPDRADLAYGYEVAPTGERLPLAWLGFIPEAAKRTSNDLSEDIWSGKLDYALPLWRTDAKLRFGGAYRHTSRDSKSLSYNLRALGLDAQQRAATPDQLFYGSYTQGDQSRIFLEPNSAGGTYSATDLVSAGYVMADVPLSRRIRLTGGARVERWHLDLDAEPVTGGVANIKRTNTDVLPSLTLTFEPTESQTIRLAASQTLSRPEYRELAPISYRDMLDEREVFGDSTLVRTLVQNFDARWEWYPNLDEVVSIGLFAKTFKNPIEQIDVATSGVSQLSFMNAKSATNYGVELELRKHLGFVGDALEPLSLYANATLMKSTINTSNSNLSALTNDNRPMVGQAPYVVNAGLTYAEPGGALSATLLYNVVGRRITSAAVKPLNVDTYEQPRNVVDFSMRFPVYGGMTGRFDARNLLDAPYEELQGDVVRYRYNTGRSFSLGLSWRVM